MQLTFRAAILTYLAIPLAPFALFYAWFQYSKRLRKEVHPVRNGFTLVSLSLVSLTVGLLPIAWILTPKDYSAAVHYGDQWVDFVIMPICLVAAILSLFGRPRVIVPIVIVCWGTVLLWAVSLPSH